MQPELLSIIQKTTQYLKSNGAPNISSINNNCSNSTTTTETTNKDKENGAQPEHPLLTLLDLVYKQFKLISEAHALTLKNYQNTLKRCGILNMGLYDSVDYWNQAQIVLQIMLTDYLNIQSVSAEDQLKSSFPEQSININSFFSRRKAQT